MHRGHFVNLGHLLLVTPSCGWGTLLQSATRHGYDDGKTYAQSRAGVEIGWGGGRVVPHPHETNQMRVGGWPPPHPSPHAGEGDPPAGGRFPVAAREGSSHGWEGGIRMSKVKNLVVSHR